MLHQKTAEGDRDDRVRIPGWQTPIKTAPSKIFEGLIFVIKHCADIFSADGVFFVFDFHSECLRRTALAPEVEIEMYNTHVVNSTEHTSHGAWVATGQAEHEISGPLIHFHGLCAIPANTASHILKFVLVVK